MRHQSTPIQPGQQFGRWTVLSRGRVTPKQTYWVCRCECGTAKEVRQDHLRNGDSVSCGCYRQEQYGKQATRHGMNGSPEYHAWEAMIQRCYDPNTIGFARYGGRGIGVFEEWRQDFTAFFNDMGPKPSPKHSLDRIDNDGDYAPENCRWATPLEQANNRSSCRFITYCGRTQSLSLWAREYGMSWSTLDRRLKRGMSIDEALNTPIAKRSRQWQ